MQVTLTMHGFFLAEDFVTCETPLEVFLDKVPGNIDTMFLVTRQNLVLPNDMFANVCMGETTPGTCSMTILFARPHKNVRLVFKTKTGLFQSTEFTIVNRIARKRSSDELEFLVDSDVISELRELKRQQTDIQQTLRIMQLMYYKMCEVVSNALPSPEI